MTTTPQQGASSDGDRPETLEDGAPLASDAAPRERPTYRDRASDAPHARPAEDDRTLDDHLARKVDGSEDRQEALVDEAVEETFPASDPISPKHIT